MYLINLIYFKEYWGWSDFYVMEIFSVRGFLNDVNYVR